MKKYHETMTVLTGPDWLAEMFDRYSNKKKTAYIIPVQDPDGRWIIGKSILTDPDFDLNTIITGPTGEAKKIADWLEEIPYCYVSDEEQ